jgi:hypothetical protein
VLSAAGGAAAMRAVTQSSHVATPADTSGIAALHRADSIATIAGVASQLRDLWDSSAVRIVPGGPATVSRAAIYTEDSTYRANSANRNIVRYVTHYQPAAIHGNSAIEWGYFDATVVISNGGRADSTSFRGNALRVLKQQADGSWRFSHVIINSAGR